jgi:Zn-dependent protease/CBS domain-containing protein
MANIPSWASGHDDARPEASRRQFPHRRTENSEPVDSAPAEAARMPWSWRIGRVAGIEIYIHATFLLLIAWLLMIHLSHGSSIEETILGIAFVMALFACIVLHEYGHALTARRYGIKTRDITLLPIGGVARLERIPKDPRQELLVALAGPAVNVLIAGVLYLVVTLVGFDRVNVPVETSRGEFVGSNPLWDLMRINLFLALFNLLPAFPMDGGRVLRAVLAMKIPRIRATKIASILGQMMAVFFALIGFGMFPDISERNPFLVFIALFVYLGASQEYQTIRWEAAVEGLTARDAMVTNFRSLVASDQLGRAVSLLLQGTQHDFPVLDDNFRVVGLLLRQDLISALSKDGGAQLPVSKAMCEKFASARPDESLVNVFERMQAAQLPVLPVFGEEDKLVGLLTMENVAEVVMVRNALEKAQAEHQSRQAG